MTHRKCQRISVWLSERLSKRKSLPCNRTMRSSVRRIRRLWSTLTTLPPTSWRSGKGRYWRWTSSSHGIINSVAKWTWPVWDTLYCWMVCSRHVVCDVCTGKFNIVILCGKDCWLKRNDLVVDDVTMAMFDVDAWVHCGSTKGPVMRRRRWTYRTCRRYVTSTSKSPSLSKNHRPVVRRLLLVGSVQIEGCTEQCSVMLTNSKLIGMKGD